MDRPWTCGVAGTALVGTALLAAAAACSRDAQGALGRVRVEEPPPSLAAAGPATAFEVRVDSAARGGGSWSAALPRLTMDSREAATPSPGRRLYAPGSAAFRSALSDARPGDVIVLSAGATYEGNFRVPRKAGAGPRAWITIRTGAPWSWQEGTRVRPGVGARPAKLVTPNRDPALAFESGAAYYRVVGLEITSREDDQHRFSLVALGDAGPDQRTTAAVPHHLVLDRVYVHGTPHGDLRRCVSVSSAWTAVVDSWVSDCHSNDGDSQAVWGSNGPGPYLFTGNRLEGAGENLMFGGSDPPIRGLVPGDVTITRNYFFKPMSWRGAWSVKNLLELKTGVRVLVEGNVFENNWAGGQAGYAIVLKSVNQDGGAPWSETTDVTVRRNRLSNVAAGISLAGKPEAHPVASPLARVVVEQNLIALGDAKALTEGNEGLSRGIAIAAEPRDIALRHNTVAGARSCAVYLSTQDWGALDVVGNVFGVGSYGAIKGDGSQEPAGPNDGTDILTTYTVPGGYRFVDNVIWAPAALRPAVRATFPPPNVVVEDVREAGGVFVAPAAGNFHLAIPGLASRRGSDGAPPGVDLEALADATRGVTAGEAKAPAKAAAKAESAPVRRP